MSGDGASAGDGMWSGSPEGPSEVTKLLNPLESAPLRESSVSAEGRSALPAQGSESLVNVSAFKQILFKYVSQPPYVPG